MPAKSIERDQARQAEILNACGRLYQIKGFHDITIKDISEETSLSRPSIYNYFETKEEIFLGLLTREHAAWNKDLGMLRDGFSSLSKEAFASKLADTLANREVLLKICAMNLYEIEENSRPERLAGYKQAFKESLEIFCDCLRQFFTDYTQDDLEQIRYAFFPFLYGVYPYAYPTAKQKAAMAQVGMSYRAASIREITENFLLRLL
jgi:AcrR family transcriptional regulator